MTDRAVSDVVGFVLVFALIISTIGVVTSVGFTSLDDQQEAEQLNNVERAFDVFQNNVENVYRDGAPSRATEMRLGGGTIGYGDPVNVTVRKESNHDVNHTRSLYPLVYSGEDTDIVYAGGAVLRDDGHGSAMLNQPPFLFDAERTVLPIVRTTRSVGPSSISRPGTVRVASAFRSVNATTNAELRTADKLELVVESPRADAWADYMRTNADAVNGTVDDGTEGEAVFTFETERTSVPRFRIQLSYSE